MERKFEGFRGICILAHFCETHGPNFVFCTQQVTENNNLYVLARDMIPSSAQSIPQEKEESHSFEYPDPYASLVIDDAMKKRVQEYKEQLKSKQLYSTSADESSDNELDNELMGEEKKRTGMIDTFLHKDVSSLPSKSSKLGQKKPGCPMCSSLDEGTGYISPSRILSNSPEEQQLDIEQLYGISGKYPADSLYSIVRRIAVRALSCEVCPGLEGPLIFSEAEGKYYALSFMFKLKDSQARGQQRCYSLILLLEDSTRLLSAFNIITTQFQKIVENLKQKAISKFENEKDSNSQQRTSTQPDRRFSIRSNRGMMARSKTTLRSLEDLLDEKNIFMDLHLRFTHVLTLVNTFIASKSFGRVSFDVRIIY